MTVYASQMQLHLARQAEVVRALEAEAKALMAATRALVGSAASDPEALDRRRAEAARLRTKVLGLLEEERLHIHLLVSSQARALVERLHEAALELDLAVTLGRQDPRAADALLRARSAVARDGRALLRALLQFTAHFHHAGAEQR